MRCLFVCKSRFILWILHDDNFQPLKFEIFYYGLWLAVAPLGQLCIICINHVSILLNEFFITRTRISKINRCFHFRIGNYYFKPRVPSIHLKENYTDSKSNRTKSNYKINDIKNRILFKCNNVTNVFCVLTCVSIFPLLQIKHDDVIFVNHVVCNPY